MEKHVPVTALADFAECDDQEACGIAVDLIADLGAEDAVAWADEYMNDLEADERPGAARRWRRVTDALAQLTVARQKLN